MKRIVFIPLFMTILIANAQHKGLTYEVSAIAGKSWYSNYSNKKSHFHWQTGVNMIYNFNRFISLGSGFALSSEGSTENNYDNTRSNYLRIPAFVRISGGERIKFINPYIDFGISYGYLVGGKSTKTSAVPTLLPGGGYITEKVKTKDLIANRNDLGLFAQIGVNNRIGKNIWMNIFATTYHGWVQQIILMGGSNNPFIANRNIALGISLLYQPK